MNLEARKLDRKLPMSARIGLAILAFVGLLALLAPLIAPADPNQQFDIVGGRLLPPLSTRYAIELTDGRWLLAEKIEDAGPNLRIRRGGHSQSIARATVANLAADGLVEERRFFLFGTDKFSRDVSSRWLFGARASLSLGVFSVALATLLGVAVGCLAAFGGPLVDLVLMRLADGLLAFPWYFLMVALVAIFPTDVATLVLLLGCSGWMSISRLTRAQLRSLAQREFILSSRALGLSRWQLARRHFLPNALTPVATDATLRVGNLILIEASLSYLGLGIPAPQASWGNMIADGQDHLLSSWWVATVPGVSIVCSVIALTFLSDGLQHAMEPRINARPTG